MTTSETTKQHYIPADITEAIASVSSYPHYGTSQDVIDHFAGLSRQTPTGVAIDMGTVGHQTKRDGTEVPLVRIDIDLGTDGYTLYEKGGVHGNELAYRPTFKETGNLAVRQPELFRRLGIGRIVLLDTDRVSTDLNTWSQQEMSIRSYLRSFWRGPEVVDWGYPVDYDGYRFVATAAGCLASQDTMREIRPHLVAPLHNATLSGPYAYLRNAPEGFAAQLSKALHGLYGFPFGFPDIEPSIALADGIYDMPAWQKLYDHYKAKGIVDSYAEQTGESSIDFAERMARAAGDQPVVGVITESAYFLPQNAADIRPSGYTQRQARTQILDNATRLIDTVDDLLPQVLAGREADPWGLAHEIKASLRMWRRSLKLCVQ